MTSRELLRIGTGSVRWLSRRATGESRAHDGVCLHGGHELDGHMDEYHTLSGLPVNQRNSQCDSQWSGTNWGVLSTAVCIPSPGATHLARGLTKSYSGVASTLFTFRFYICTRPPPPRTRAPCVWNASAPTVPPAQTAPPA